MASLGSVFLVPSAPPTAHYGRSRSLLTGSLIPPLTALSPAPAQPLLWQYVISRFEKFVTDIGITSAQHADGMTKQAGVRACLNRAFWGYSSETDNSLLIGSWGKTTRVGPPRDVDILFLLPAEVYYRFEGRSGNRQSQLLQEVRNALSVTYPQTTMRADGQVVIVPFNSMPIEVSPGFRWSDGTIKVCDTNGGGKYITSTAEAELADLDAVDSFYGGNARALARMTKRWQDEHHVPIRSFEIERLAVQFLRRWRFAHEGFFYYDWMVRDFFEYLAGEATGWIKMPGTGEMVWLTGEWLHRATRAHSHAVRACEFERANNNSAAGEEWRCIFGSAVPLIA